MAGFTTFPDTNQRFPLHDPAQFGKAYAPGAQRFYPGGVGGRSLLQTGYGKVSNIVRRGAPQRHYGSGSFISSKTPGDTGALRSTLTATTGLHGAGMSAVRDLYGVGKTKGLWRAFGPAALGMAAYGGYQEGGVSGAVGEMASETATWYALGAGMKLAGPLALGAVAGVGAAALGLGAVGVGPQHFARPYVHDYMKKRARLEMGTPVMDPYGQVATMRQRSIMAMNNSRVNGRTAIGNEAFLLSQGGF
jgi:hypothetical protein